MTEQTTAVAADPFDLGAFDAKDEITHNILNPVTDLPTGWLWTFYGPGHPVTVQMSERLSREILQERRAKEQAQVNGKKWKADEREPQEFAREAATNIATRVKEFTPIRLNGEQIVFSKEAVIQLLLDPKKGWLYAQIQNFLRDDANFIKPSPKG